MSVLVDLRSDTVTVPTTAMREAMAQAAVGDDVYGEDPTLNELQAEVARLTGHEAALFMPTGTMSNQVALALHTGRGEEVICAQGSHIYEWELGMMAVFSSLSPRFVPAPLGVPDPEQVRLAVQRGKFQTPTGLISLENTHNKAGGTIIPLEVIRQIRAVADTEGLPLHLDGARVFNAAVALGVPLNEITAQFDTVSICLSKGLGAPVGSVLTGSKEHIDRAWRYRKMMGGGMRQAGSLAAAGLIALRDGPGWLAEDHRRTRQLAGALLAAGYDLDLNAVQTNVIYVTVPDAPRRVQEWAAQGVRCSAISEQSVRFVFHHQVNDEGLARATAVLTA